MKPRRVVLAFVMCALFRIAGAASAEELRALGSFGPDAVLSSGAGFGGEAGRVEATDLPFIVVASDCVESEPNDRLTQANPIANPGLCTGKAAANDSHDVYITYSNGTKDGIEDIFVVKVGYSTRLEVTLWATGLTSSNHDVFLFSAAGGNLNLIQPLGNTASNRESIVSANVLTPGTYYIGVSAAKGSANYSLVVSPGPAGTPPAAPSDLTATATSSKVIRLNWNDNAHNEAEFRVEQKDSGGTFVDIGPASANATTIDVTGFSGGQTGTFRIRARNGFGDSAYSNEASATTPGGIVTCRPSSTTVCLLSNRFGVAIEYRNQFSNPPGQTGNFVVQRLDPLAVNPDTAIFGFGSPQAVEVVVRLVDARPFAPRFDVYYGGLTDVEYTVTVTDTQTGTIRQYRNQPGTVGGGVDRTSFPAH